MSEKPILFSAPMVLAILAGTKTQTRRIIKCPPHYQIEEKDDGKPLADLIGWLETKGQLTEAQRAQLQPEQPAVTYAQVFQRMQDARTPDQLNEAASLIAAIKDEAQRKELEDHYQGFVDSMNDSTRP